jgi:DNA-binding SARP family transcriptional activator
MATSVGFPSVLPFALSRHDVAPAAEAALLDRIGELQRMMAEAHGALDTLHRDNVELMRLVAESRTATAGVAGGVKPPLAPAVRHAAPATPAPNAPLRLRFLGSFEACAGDGPPAAWSSRKSRMLLAYLAHERGRPVAKERLIEVFWPESAPARGANNLSIAIYQVRAWLRQIGAAPACAIEVGRGLYRLAAGPACSSDAEAFEAHLRDAGAAEARGDRESARGLRAAAVALYRGDFLESDLCEEWTAAPRRHYAELLRDALSWLAEDAVGQADWSGASACAEQLLARDRCDEAAHRLAMTVHARMGNRARAIHQYRACERALRDDLDVAPSPLTDQVLRRIVG